MRGKTLDSIKGTQVELGIGMLQTAKDNGESQPNWLLTILSVPSTQAQPAKLIMLSDSTAGKVLFLCPFYRWGNQGSNQPAHPGAAIGTVKRGTSVYSDSRILTLNHSWSCNSKKPASLSRRRTSFSDLSLSHDQVLYVLEQATLSGPQQSN